VISNVESEITLSCDEAAICRMQLRSKKLLNYQKEFFVRTATIDLYSEVLKILCEKNANRLV